ncbi:uncharacterized protein LOC141852227 [Brevipalpus obovatus]|uniref:uncharacterized protein LOC141852227 n=1 Tax=Brevipalpus obovatus TaxID=246614 RepID=UPI003D9F90FA
MALFISSLCKFRPTNTVNCTKILGCKMFTSNEVSQAVTSKKEAKQNELLELVKNMPIKPKPPGRDGFQVYCEERMAQLLAENPNINRKVAKQTLQDEWERLERKEPYNHLHTKDLASYKEKKSQYDMYMKRTITVKDMLTIVDYMKRYEAKKRKEISKIKSQFPTSAYKLFIKEYTGSQREAGHGPPTLVQTSVAFKELSQVEKDEYERRAHENKIKVDRAIQEMDHRKIEVEGV